MNSTKKTRLTRNGKQLSDFLKSLFLFPNELVPLIVLYWQSLKFETTPFQIWTLREGDHPRSILFHPQQSIFYVANQENLTILNDQGKILSEKNTRSLSTNLYNIWTLEIDTSKNYLHFIDKNCFTTLDLKSSVLQTIICSWNLPSNGGNLRYFKLNGDQTLYLTIADHDSMYRFSLEGKQLKRFSPYKTPYGITLDDQFLYLCENGNSRVLVLDKETGQQSHIIGDKQPIESPFGIHLCDHSILCIGTHCDLQIWSIEGKFIQKIGNNKNINCIFGLNFINDILYVCDFYNHRIQLFRGESFETDLVPRNYFLSELG